MVNNQTLLIKMLTFIKSLNYICFDACALKFNEKFLFEFCFAYLTERFNDFSLS